MTLINKSALEILKLLQSKEICAVDLLQALERRIRDIDTSVNALPTLCFERAYAHAKKIDALAVGQRGCLSGLPVPIKDLSDVSGVRSTFGSRIFSDTIPKTSAHVVERIESENGIVYAKSNTPEFGAGANTFNDVFGATRNPWDLRMSAAGSSGGAAAALATGMAWLAHGSDMGGSLRNPASFCGVVGLRPSPGRVPNGPSQDPYDTLGTQGPMARNVTDVALLLDALSGPDSREPISLPKPRSSFLSSALEPRKPKRVAFGAGLGITPVDQQVLAVCKRAAKHFEDMGVVVEEAHPDFSGAHETFQTLRAQSFAISLGPLLDHHEDKLKPEIVWNIKKGLALTAKDIRKAMVHRGQLINRAHAFFETYDLLLTPATIVPPYPVEQRYPESCDGVTFETYVDWLAIAYAITLVSLPALSLPCGFTKDGLPVGLQMVGRTRGEHNLIRAARCLEDTLALPSLPIDPRKTATPQT